MKRFEICPSLYISIVDEGQKDSTSVVEQLKVLPKRSHKLLGDEIGLPSSTFKPVDQLATETTTTSVKGQHLNHKVVT